MVNSVGQIVTLHKTYNGYFIQFIYIIFKLNTLYKCDHGAHYTFECFSYRSTGAERESEWECKQLTRVSTGEGRLEMLERSAGLSWSWMTHSVFLGLPPPHLLSLRHPYRLNLNEWKNAQTDEWADRWLNGTVYRSALWLLCDVATKYSMTNKIFSKLTLKLNLEGYTFGSLLLCSNHTVTVNSIINNN